jgi:hypothetical protein
MTPLQQAYLQKLSATAKANMAFFEMNMPMLHNLLVRDVPTATVDISDQGDLSIRYLGGEVKKVAEDILSTETKLVRFEDILDRPQILAFHKLRSVSSNPGHGDLQEYHYSNLDAEFQNRARAHFAEHYPDNSELYRYPEFGENHIPLLIVVGSGLGWHLPRLLLKYQIRRMVIIDTDADKFRLSTYFHDYVQLSRLAIEKGTNITFMVQSEIEEISRMLMGVLQGEAGLPPFFIHGASLFYSISDGELVEEIKSSIVDTLWELFFGLGYFDDELISIKHTFCNLINGVPVYKKNNSMSAGSVAFVVGSGPSLDALLPTLKLYQDKAVIFSCGTALSVLANAGIHPDFHVEKERPSVIHEVITSTVERDFLKGIHFLGLNVIYPGVFDLFEEKGMIFKAADTMSALMVGQGLQRDLVLNTQPTVTNSAIDFVLSVGFKEVYLFGVDMGYKDVEKHHSRHTAYLDNMPKAEHLRRLLSIKESGDFMSPGNFGGEIFTSKMMFIANKYFGFSVKKHPDARVYNLNDGALIRNTIPLRPDCLSLRATQADKIKSVEDVKSAFAVECVDIPDLIGQLQSEFGEFIRDVDKILRDKCKNRFDVIETIECLYQYMQSVDFDSKPQIWAFRGGLLNLLSLTYNAITIIKDEDEAVAKAVFDFSNIMEFLNQAILKVGSVCDVVSTNARPIA